MRDAADVHRHGAESRAAERGRSGRCAPEAIQRGSCAPGEGRAGGGESAAQWAPVETADAGAAPAPGAVTGRRTGPAAQGSFSLWFSSDCGVGRKPPAVERGSFHPPLRLLK